MRAPADLLTLILPRQCAGCARPDVTLCRTCRRLLTEPAWRCEESTFFLAAQDGMPALGLPTWTLAEYAGPVRRIVLAWKSGQRPDLDRELCLIAAAAVERLAPDIVVHDGAPALVVVPAPSGWRRRLRRRLVARTLAFAVGRALARRSHGEVWTADLLRRRGGSGHALGARARRQANREAIRHVGAIPRGTPCLLVDDVVTTGATLDASRVALEAAGGVVVGAFVLAATPTR